MQGYFKLRWDFRPRILPWCFEHRVLHTWAVLQHAIRERHLQGHFKLLWNVCARILSRSIEQSMLHTWRRWGRGDYARDRRILFRLFFLLFLYGTERIQMDGSACIRVCWFHRPQRSRHDCQCMGGRTVCGRRVHLSMCSQMQWQSQCGATNQEHCAAFIKHAIR